MIKCETVGMIDVAKNNPVLTSASDVSNYSFITDNGEIYLIANTISGDDSYVEGAVIKAGDYLNGFLVRAWETQNLVVDEKHIAYGSGQSYASITANTTLFTVGTNGKLEIASEAPESGVYFKAVEKTRLTEAAVKVRIMVA